MNIFRYIGEGYLRLRHSRGFGVHSPFAFGITELLRERHDYSYYDEYELKDEAFARGSRRLWHDCFIVFRLCSRLTAANVWSGKDAGPVIEHAARLAVPDMKRMEGEKSLRESDVIIFPDKSPEEVVRTMKDGAVAFFRNPSAAEMAAALGSLPGGLLLISPSRALLFRRDSMHRTSYTTRL